MKIKKQNRKRFSATERITVFEKTNGRCHFCGGKLEGKWVVAHVEAHDFGGIGSNANLLPAHWECNRLLWFYIPENRRLIFKLGVYAFREFNKKQKNKLGELLVEMYEKRESKNQKRRVNYTS